MSTISIVAIKLSFVHFSVLILSNEIIDARLLEHVLGHHYNGHDREALPKSVEASIEYLDLKTFKCGNFTWIVKIAQCTDQMFVIEVDVILNVDELRVGFGRCENEMHKIDDRRREHRLLKVDESAVLQLSIAAIFEENVGEPSIAVNETVESILAGLHRSYQLGEHIIAPIFL